MRWTTYFGLTFLLFGILIATAFLAGEPVYGIPVAIVAAIVLAFFVLNRMVARRAMTKHGGDPEAAVADSEDTLPSSHVITDEDTALGDTAEAHSEINPHDLPPDHPGRAEAERQAAGQGGTTRGSQELLEVGPDRDESGGRSGGQPARPVESAERAK